MRIRNKLNNPAVRAGRNIFLYASARKSKTFTFHLSRILALSIFIPVCFMEGVPAVPKLILIISRRVCVKENIYAPSKLTPSIRIYGFHFGCNYRVASVPRDKIYQRLFLRLPNSVRLRVRSAWFMNEKLLQHTINRVVTNPNCSHALLRFSLNSQLPINLENFSSPL